MSEPLLYSTAVFKYVDTKHNNTAVFIYVRHKTIFYRRIYMSQVQNIKIPPYLYT